MLKVFNINNDEGLFKYKSHLAEYGKIEPYYLPEFIELFSEGIKNLICFSYESENSDAAILMPGYLKPILVSGVKTGSFDFISPYGYTGPLHSANTNQSDFKQFWNEVDNWYRGNNVITEFIRFNLNFNYLGYSGDIFPTMLNIKGAIIDEELQWKSFEHKVRKNVNRALRENLQYCVYFRSIPIEKIREFHAIYIATMKRTNAKDSFMYSFESFIKFIQSVSGPKIRTG